MTHYAEEAGRVRASLFKPSGKWYLDQSIDMEPHYNEPDIHRAVMLAWGDAVETDWVLVVLEPHHKNAYPVMIKGS